MDADSDIVTAINVLPAKGDEGADAGHLIKQEEQAHGNDVQALSMDGAGYRGTLLQELTDPQGLNLEVFLPPTEPAPPKGFAAERFTLSADGGTLTFPAGQSTPQRGPNRHDPPMHFRFAAAACPHCPPPSQSLTAPLPQPRPAQQ